MVEDTLENLRTAKRLGMKTVWVRRAGRAPGYVDIAISDIAKLPRVVARLQ
jgi:putative hydrolase of the HAD superfamily